MVELTANTTMAVDHVQIDAGGYPINGLVGEANGNIHLDNIAVQDWAGTCNSQTITGFPQIAGNGDAEFIVTQSGGIPASLTTGLVSRGNAAAGIPDGSVIVYENTAATPPYLVLSKPIQTPTTSTASFMGKISYNSTTHQNTLTVTSTVIGSIVVGYYVQGGTLPASTVITGGSGTVYTISGTGDLTNTTAEPMTTYYYPYASFMGSISGTSLAVTMPAANSVFTPGQYVLGTNVAPSTVITGGTSSPYTVSVSQTISPAEPMTASVYPIATFMGSISGTTLMASSPAGAAIAIGQYVQGYGVAPGTYINGTSGSNYTVSVSQSISMEPMSASSPTSITFNQDASGILWGPGVNGGGSLSNINSIENAGATAADSNHYGYAFECAGNHSTSPPPNSECNDVAIDHGVFIDGVAPIYMDSGSGGVHLLSAEIDNENFPARSPTHKSHPNSC
jgi:hypothetical protein